MSSSDRDTGVLCVLNYSEGEGRRFLIRHFVASTHVETSPWSSTLTRTRCRPSRWELELQTKVLTKVSNPGEGPY